MQNDRTKTHTLIILFESSSGKLTCTRQPSVMGISPETIFSKYPSRTDSFNTLESMHRRENVCAEDRRKKWRANRVLHHSAQRQYHLPSYPIFFNASLSSTAHQQHPYTSGPSTGPRPASSIPTIASTAFVHSRSSTRTHHAFARHFSCR